MANWEAIRCLDEEENWVERNRVLSKSDHLQIVEEAAVIVEDIVKNLPISPGQPSCESEYGYMNEFTDDDFKYSAAQFDVDYLETVSSEDISDHSDLSRKSLFVKFDPLVEKRAKGGAPANKVQLIPKSEGDLLLFGTPPPSEQTSKAWSSSTQVVQSHVLSPLGAMTADSHPPSLPAIPETGSLVNVLKYSEDDLPELLEAAQKSRRDTETKKYECQINALREKVANARQQLQQNNKKKETFQAKSVLQNTSNEKAEQDLAHCWEKLKSHLERETDLHLKHGEFKKDVVDVEEQLELIARDSNSLENSFDELHHLYVKQKAVHQFLLDRNKVIQQYMAELKSWTREDGESRDEMQMELKALQQRAEETFETMRKEHTSRMTVERTKTLKLKMQQENLDKTYKQKEEEKQQVSQICDELMKELETMQKIG